ncbi:hypothetical protein D3C75_644000 [compost metagenome]
MLEFQTLGAMESGEGNGVLPFAPFGFFQFRLQMLQPLMKLHHGFQTLGNAFQRIQDTQQILLPETQPFAHFLDGFFIAQFPADGFDGIQRRSAAHLFEGFLTFLQELHLVILNRGIPLQVIEHGLVVIDASYGLHLLTGNIRIQLQMDFLQNIRPFVRKG